MNKYNQLKLGKSLNNGYSKYASFETSFAPLLNNSLIERFTESFASFVTTSVLCKQFPYVSMTKDGKYIAISINSVNIYLSKDYGVTWKSLRDGLTSPFNSYTSVFVSNDAKIMVYNGWQSLFYSTDQGTTWTKSTPNDAYSQLTISYPSNIVGSDDGSVLYGGGYKVCKSVDGGKNWTIISEIGLNEGDLCMNFACSGDGSVIIFARKSGDGSGRIFISRDSGNSWAATSLLKMYSQKIFCSNDGNIISISAYDTAANPTIYVSTDNGNTWTAKKTLQPKFKCASGFGMSGDGSTMIFGGQNWWGGPKDVVISKDLGDTWNKVSAPQYNWEYFACSNDGSIIVGAPYNRHQTNDYISIYNTDSIKKDAIIAEYNAQIKALTNANAQLSESNIQLKTLGDNNIRIIAENNTQLKALAASNVYSSQIIAEDNAKLSALSQSNTQLSQANIQLKTALENNSQLKIMSETDANLIAEINAKLKALGDANALMIAEDNAKIRVLFETNSQLKTLADANSKIIEESNVKLNELIQANDKLKTVAEFNSQLKVAGETNTQLIAQTNAKLAALAETNAQIQAETNAKIAALAEASAQIRTLSETNSQLRILDETNKKIAALAETNAQIQAETNAKIAALAETSAQIRTLSETNTQLRILSENNSELRISGETNAKIMAETNAKLRALSETNTQLKIISENNQQIIDEDRSKLKILAETNIQLQAIADSLDARKYKAPTTSEIRPEIRTEVLPPRNLCPKTALSDWKYTDIQYIIGPDTGNQAYPECGKQFDTLAATNIKKGKGNLVFPTRALPNGLTYNQCNPSTLSDLQATAASWGPDNKVLSTPSKCSSSTGLFASKPISNNPASEGRLPSNITPVPVSSNNVRTLCDKKVGSDWKYSDIQYIVGPATGNQAYPECSKVHETLAATHFKKTGKNLVFSQRVLPNGLSYTQCNPSTLTDLQTTAAIWGPENIVATVPSNCGKNTGLVAPTPFFNNSPYIAPLNKITTTAPVIKTVTKTVSKTIPRKK